MEWVEFESLEATYKDVGNSKKNSYGESLKSKTFLVRWRFSGSKGKWDYSFANVIMRDSKKSSYSYMPIHMAISGVSGKTEVSHYMKIVKPKKK